MFFRYLFFLISCTAFSQVNLLNSERPEQIGVLSENQKESLSDKKYLQYPYETTKI